eukprot:jgi/Mesen1/3081/ME000183S02131
MAEGKQYNLRNPSVKRILQEIKEMQRDPSKEYTSMPIEEDIFEWQFAIHGPPDTEFEGGIYHGRIILPAEYPLKPPAFMLLTPSGRFEVQTKICLSISQHHPEQWQPSWSVRTALVALVAFMPTKPDGALGSLDYTKVERRKLAILSRARPPKFGSSERQKIINQIHETMMASAPSVPELKPEVSAATPGGAVPAEEGPAALGSSGGGEGAQQHHAGQGEEGSEPAVVADMSASPVRHDASPSVVVTESAAAVATGTLSTDAHIAQGSEVLGRRPPGGEDGRAGGSGSREQDRISSSAESAFAYGEMAQAAPLGGERLFEPSLRVEAPRSLREGRADGAAVGVKQEGMGDKRVGASGPETRQAKAAAASDRGLTMLSVALAVAIVALLVRKILYAYLLEA